MFTRTTSLGTAMLACLTAAICQADARAQVYGPGGYYNVNPYVYNGPAGGYLSGAGDVINAQAKFMTEQQRARVIKQQAEQARVDTRRRVFDERKYELDNTPTQQELREKEREVELRRAMKTPTMVAIWSGDALNKILEDAVTKQARGEKMPDIPLDADSLKRISVSPATGGSVGVLKSNGGKLVWPLTLLGGEYDTDRKEVERLFAEVVKQAKAGNIDRALLPDIDKAIRGLRVTLQDNVNDLTPSQHIGAKRYLGYLDDSVKALQDPSAVNYFNDKWTASGKDVDELVKNMRTKGLRFSPAAPGDESAYLALHAALAAYDGSLVAEVRTKQ